MKISVATLIKEPMIGMTYVWHIEVGAGFNGKQRSGELKPAQGALDADEVKHPIAWFCRGKKVYPCRHPCHLEQMSVTLLRDQQDRDSSLDTVVSQV